MDQSTTVTLIRDMPADERPRERLRMRGAESLTNPELIAILLRTGSAGENVLALSQRILSTFDGLRGLGRVGFGPLAAEYSMGHAKACQLLAAIELGKRVAHATPDRTRTIRAPEDVYAMLFAEMALLEQEQLKVLLLNTRNEVLAVKDVYRGNVSAAIVRMAELFKDAVREGCPSIILAHNHPSGDPSPSAEDVALTRQAIDAGKLLGVAVLDHMVLARSGFVSFKDRRLAFE
ncbi:MAG: DNA repair protein RadC [Dehalococcoidia bacterium]